MSVLRLPTAMAVLVLVLLAGQGGAGAQEIRKSATTGQSSAATPRVDEPYSVTKIVLSMAAVTGLIFALKWGTRKMVPGAGLSRQSRSIAVVSRLAVAPRQQLLLVKVGRRVVLVSNSGAAMNALCEITDPDEVATVMGQIESEKASAPMVGAFGSLFRNHEEKFEPGRSADDAGTEYDSTSPPMEEEQVGAAREELNGLAERVRLLSKNFHRS